MRSKNKWGCRDITAYKMLDNDDPEMTIVSETTNLPSGSTSYSDTLQYLRVQNLNLTVYQAAKGGGGKLKIFDQASTNTQYWIFDVNGVKDIPLSFGEVGIAWAFERNIKLVLYGAAVEQAKVCVGLTGYIDTVGNTT